MKQIVTIAITLVAGFVAGFVVRPMIGGSPAGASAVAAVTADRPTDAEASAAVQRSRKFFGKSNATVKLSECTPSTFGPGVQCTGQLIDPPGAQPLNVLYGFSRINGQWERTS